MCESSVDESESGICIYFLSTEISRLVRFCDGAKYIHILVTKPVRCTVDKTDLTIYEHGREVLLSKNCTAHPLWLS